MKIQMEDRHSSIIETDEIVMARKEEWPIDSTGPAEDYTIHIKTKSAGDLSLIYLTQKERDEQLGYIAFCVGAR
jgi:hypothetical protein